MGSESEILEPDLDFVLENTSPEDILNFMGIPGLSMEQLLDSLKIGAIAAIRMLQNYDPKYLKDYHALGKKYAPVAYAIFTHLSGKDRQPRLPVWMVANRFEGCGCYPNSIKFWGDPDLISGLYQSLEKEGYYAPAS
jgi:hypothetical protein